MRYWWVNQSRSYTCQVPGGYLWSRRRNSNGTRNPFYDVMRVVAPGDIVFSYADAQVKAVGVAHSHCYAAPEPPGPGKPEVAWTRIGWRADVDYTELDAPIRPCEHMHRLTGLLPDRYAPLRANGEVPRNAYLTNVSNAFAAALTDLLGRQAQDIVCGAKVADASDRLPAQPLLDWEAREIEAISADADITEPTRVALISAQRGEGAFKINVRKVERRCRLTYVSRAEHLVACHCKPWRESGYGERLDGENGLLLTPAAGHLFERGFISFEDGGGVLVSPVADRVSLMRMGFANLDRRNVGGFTARQRMFLEFHRENVFLNSGFLGTPPPAS